MRKNGRYAFLRGIYEKNGKGFKMEQTGSEKKYSFCIPPERETKRVAVYEACIDALAHMTLEEGNRDKYRLSLGGIAAPKENAQIQSERFKKPPDALEEFLKNHSEIKEIEICTDNDFAGRWATVLKDQSVRVQIEDDLPDKVQAQYNPRYRTIYIRNGMSEVTTFHALNRELACAALDQHTGTYSRQKVSAQAYCAAYVIAKRYGVDVTGFNLEYIAQRNECGKKDPQELRDFLNDVRQASYSIRNHIERNFGAKEQEYVTDEFAIGDPVKTPETKDEKASGKEKKAKNQPER